MPGPPRLEAAQDNSFPSTGLTTSTSNEHQTAQHSTRTTMNSTNSAQQTGHFGKSDRNDGSVLIHDKIRDEVDDMESVKEKLVRPSLAKRLAQAACVTAALVNPLYELVGMVKPQVDIMEIACSSTSTLTRTFEDHGFYGKRINYQHGFDLDSKKGTEKLLAEVKAEPPKLGWASMVCTRMSSLQNLTPRTPEQLDKFYKRRGQDLRRCDEVVTAFEEILKNDGDVAWEWPTSAVSGWRSKPLQRLERLIKKYRKQVYWVRIDGCQYGLEWKGTPLKKAWTILTSCRDLWLTLNKRCDHTHEHAECRGPAAQASAYYPASMCKAIVKAMTHNWRRSDNTTTLAEAYLLNIDSTKDEVTTADLSDQLHEHSCGGLHGPHPGHSCGDLHDEKAVMALSRNKLNLEVAPAGKKLEAVKQLMLRVHRASGHSGMSNLANLLKAKGAPAWAVSLASTLVCPDCIESSKPKPRPPASMGETPSIFEVLGTDVFEFEDEPNQTKFKMILWRDRASGLTMIDTLKVFETGAWEPTSNDIIKSMMKWQMVYPTPKWVFADAARYYSSEEYMDYLNRAGVGLTIAPAEAHWIMGFEESAINIAKGTVARLLREGSRFSVPDLFSLAAASMNAHVGPSGFSAFQWAFGAGGGPLDDEKLLVGVQPGKSFQGLVKERERAKIAFERERAAERFSKLANATGRQASQYKPGQLVMLWRQRVKPGKVKGSWTGPVRLIMMEGTTAWLSSGSTLIRAKSNPDPSCLKPRGADCNHGGYRDLPHTRHCGEPDESFPREVLQGRCWECSK